MGSSKSCPKREFYSNTILPQETRKASNRQPNFTPKTTGKRRTGKNKISRRKEIIKIRAEINEKEIKETIVKVNKTKRWFFEKIKSIAFSQIHQEKKEKNQINKIRKEKEEITTENAEI